MGTAAYNRGSQIVSREADERNETVKSKTTIEGIGIIATGKGGKS